MIARVAPLLLALAMATAGAQEPLLRRAEAVATLIESSSAARQIEGSGDAAALAKRDSARLMHREALLLLRSGDPAGAERLLDQATREMMGGARLARPGQVAGEKQRRDFDARLESTRALLVAQQRIAQEKGGQAEAVEATRRIEGLVADAEREAAAGRLDLARPLADRAYLTARVSIEALRRGDTLVRSLHFASKQEEFAYELDRNETHRMLIRMLLGERRDAASMMQGFIDRAGLLRGEAEAQARRGEHEAAIRGLEESTRELVRAIRAGGIYIPG